MSFIDNDYAPAARETKQRETMPEISTATSKAMQSVLDDAAAVDRINAATRKRFGLGPVEKSAKPAETVKRIKPVKAVKPTVPVASLATSTGKVAKREVKAVSERHNWTKPKVSIAEAKALAKRLTSDKRYGFLAGVRIASGVSTTTIYELKNGKYDGLTRDAADRLTAALDAGIQLTRKPGRPFGKKGLRSA